MYISSIYHRSITLSIHLISLFLKIYIYLWIYLHIYILHIYIYISNCLTIFIFFLCCANKIKNVCKTTHYYLPIYIYKYIFTYLSTYLLTYLYIHLYLGSLLPGVDMVRYSYENHSLEDVWGLLLNQVSIYIFRVRQCTSVCSFIYLSIYLSIHTCIYIYFIYAYTRQITRTRHTQL